MIKKIINSITWIIFAVSFVVTSVVAVAQSSVPGDSTYGIKVGFEKVVLASYRLVHKDTDYQIDLTRLRFKESQQVLKTPQAGESLANLNLQILSTQESINSIQDSAKKATFAKKFVSTLKDIKTQLDYEKTSIVNSSSTTISLSSTTTSPESDIKDDLDDTRNNIDAAIEGFQGDTDDPDLPPDTTAANPTEPLVPTLIPSINPTTTLSDVIDSNEPVGRGLPAAMIVAPLSPIPELTPSVTPTTPPAPSATPVPEERFFYPD